MPTIRIGFSSDFILKNNTVGLGTTTSAHGKLDVDGTIKGNFSVTGVATLASYGGLVAQKQQVNKPSTIGFGTVGLNTVGVSTGYQYYETETGFTDLGGVHHDRCRILVPVILHRHMIHECVDHTHQWL